MILRRVLADGPPSIDLELHPRLTVVVAEQTSAVADLLAGVLQGEVTDAAGEVEIDGIPYDLADPDLQPVSLPEGVDRLVLRAADLPADGAGGAVGDVG